MKEVSETLLTVNTCAEILEETRKTVASEAFWFCPTQNQEADFPIDASLRQGSFRSVLYFQFKAPEETKEMRDGEDSNEDPPHRFVLCKGSDDDQLPKLQTLSALYPGRVFYALPLFRSLSMVAGTVPNLLNRTCFLPLEELQALGQERHIASISNPAVAEVSSPKPLPCRLIRWEDIKGRVREPTLGRKPVPENDQTGSTLKGLPQLRVLYVPHRKRQG